MTTVHIRQSTTVSLNRFVAALINFGPGRGEIFANGHGHWVRVNVRGDTWTDVTEGSSGARWERLRCDWSELNVVRLTTIDSNIWRPESGDGDGADVAEDDMEADAKGEAERVAAGLTGSDEAPTPTGGPNTPGRPVRASGRGARERTYRGPRTPGC